MAAALLAGHLQRAGVDVDVASAGLLEGGQPASPHAISVVADRGLDLTRHRSRRLTADLVTGAELVIGMERHHLRTAAVLVSGAFHKTFTLKELVRRALETGPRAAEEPLEAYLVRLNADRDPATLVDDDPRDDVDDPVGKDRSHFEATASELELLISGLGYFLFGVSPDS